MANINDYLIWRGDLPLNSKFKFNEIDSMILARFSYLIFNKIKMQKIETIESISHKMKDFDNTEFRYNGDKEMITLLGKSERFKKMQVTDFIEHTDKIVEKQFGAITIHISEKELYISFIGTDNSLIGWKEDFNMAFMKSVPAQHDGIKYVKKITKQYPNSKIRIGGHSKGGNVSIFSAISSTKDIQDRIIKVYNYDGPGLFNDVIESIENKCILDKISTYIPQDSVIGRILEHAEKCFVVKSIEKGIRQHDIFSWEVLKDNPVFIDKVTDNSEIINKAIREWLKGTTIEERKIFFDGVFEVIDSTDANTLDEISISLSRRIPAFFKTYRNLSEKDRRIISQALREFGKSYATNYRLQLNSTKRKK